MERKDISLNTQLWALSSELRVLLSFSANPRPQNVRMQVENHLKRTTESPIGSVPMTVLPYHAAIDARLRPSNLQAFLAPPGAAPMALICTDRASRGLDSATCNHVVLFDLPRDPSEYVRRAGRTARGTSSGGTVSILVLGRQLRVARQIVARNERQLPIHRLPELPD